MSQTGDDLRVAVKERFARVARSPGQVQKFPVGPESAKELGYDPQEIDALSRAAGRSRRTVEGPALFQGHPGCGLRRGGGGAIHAERPRLLTHDYPRTPNDKEKRAQRPAGGRTKPRRPGAYLG